ncbi:MAG: MarR family transcriptional regulator [Gemmatimonadetes bacterium]|nr:MAG: MarR family transcriptional regulator [Gemmatimonadota bacterium]
MNEPDAIKHEMIQSFGDAYQSFGLSALMGHIVALLLYYPRPLSLDEITDELGRSKGPISQIVRRLAEKNLIRKVWVPDTRKDYYEIQPEIFANAFRNQFELIKNNTRLAERLQSTVEAANENGDLSTLSQRMREMHRFYTLMEKYHQLFLEEWAVERKKLYEHS